MCAGSPRCDCGLKGASKPGEAALDRYPNISDHGIIGDLQTVALIARDGTWTSSAARGSTLPVSSRPCSTRTKVGISRSHRRRASSRRATRSWLSTLHALDSELSPTACLVHRYNPAASRDGLHGDEGALSLCTFLYVDALARAGRLEDGRADLREDADLRQPPEACTPRRSAPQASSSVTSRRHSPTLP